MYMNMAILMTMNIYITKANEEWLRTQTSMSGTINSLLDAQRGVGASRMPQVIRKGQSVGKTLAQPIVAEYTTNPKTYLGGKTIQDPSPVEQDLLDSLPVTPACCLLKTPCKHWIWSGEQMAYVNTISGEIKSVEV